jgi:2-succinyl-5-enolpyruvyl-6-hydroxy-3-cyclohexene-1-carboxylate synthase
MNKPISDKPVVKTLIDLCHQHGVAQVIISPGSRNAPLILSFSGSQLFECITIVDERSAGYFALGLARATQKPVALVCTSGTAALNLAPAIAEAYYQQIPLIAITADRPVEWIDQVDGQAINQQGIFSNFTRFQCQLPATIINGDDDWYTNRVINEALLKATGNAPGPVHINVPLKEPLYGKTIYPAKQVRMITQVAANNTFSEDTLQLLTSELAKFDRVMVLMGACVPDEGLKNAIITLADKGVLVLTETLSNVENDAFIGNMDRVVSTISEEDYAIFAPDLLITIDVPVLSRMIKKLIRTRKPSVHWHLSNQLAITDTYQSVTRLIQGDAPILLGEIAEQMNQKNNRFVTVWKKRANQMLERHKSYLTKISWCDLKLFETLSETPFPHRQIHLGNSTPVRYAQLFDWNRGHKWFANRGTSGIDGCLSSAVGAAHGSDEPVLLIVGDLSFFYDSNGLWNNYLKPNFRIILINNSGGGIFRFIAGPSETEELEEFFEAKQTMNAQGIAKTFGLNYIACNNETTFKEALKNFFEPSEKPMILEVFTPNVENGIVLKGYFKCLKERSNF